MERHGSLELKTCSSVLKFDHFDYTLEAIICELHCQKAFATQRELFDTICVYCLVDYCLIPQTVLLVHCMDIFVLF